MRVPNLLLAVVAGLLVVGLAACSGSAPAPGPYPRSPTSSVTAPAATSATASAPAESMGGVAAEPETKDGARAAAAKFYEMYSADQFSTSWGLLSATTRQAVPRATWISVHNGCPAAGTGSTRVIKSVLVFGNAAIVTETIAGANSRLGAAEDIFNYANGRWGYTPNDLSIYHHGSIAADIAAAKALGFCSGKNATPL